MEFNWIVYLIGVLVSIVLGLRGIGVFGIFSNETKYKIKDILFVIIVSVIAHWFTAYVFYFGYGRPCEGHPDII